MDDETLTTTFSPVAACTNCGEINFVSDCVTNDAGELFCGRLCISAYRNLLASRERIAYKLRRDR